jgi:hypothetical protein
MTNEFILTIKQNDSTLPMIIDPTDIFELKLFILETDEEVVTITMTDTENVGVIDIYDDANGQIKVTLYDTLVNSLSKERGTKADHYYLKPLYRIAIDCTTVNNGNFVAKVNKVYVD